MFLARVCAPALVFGERSADDIPPRSAPTRETADRPPRLRSRRSRWTCVCSRERGENLRAARPIARAIRSRCAEAMVDFGMST